jgi:sulfite exporter TauE/SafE/copper chaperone CopZ
MASKTGKRLQNRSVRVATITTEVPIAGMTCRACEIRVADVLCSLPVVTAAKVSISSGVATVTSTKELDPKAVSAAVAAAGYRVCEDPRLLLSRDRQVWTDIAAIVAILVLVVLVGRMLGLGLLADNLSELATSGNLVFVVLLGVAASISTCMALVGGLVMSLSARFAEAHPQASSAQRLRPQLMFNLGRIVGFSALGALVGIAGSAISLSGTALAIAMIAVSTVMGVLGIKLTGISPRLGAMAFTLPPALTSWMRRGNQSASYRDTNALLLGAASFFLPCGFTQAVQVYALSTGSPVQSALVMGLFAVGTTPGLMGVGALSAFAKGPNAARIFRVIGVVVIGFAFLNLNGAFSNLGVTFDTSSAVASTVTTRTENVTDTAVGQQIQTTVAGGYQPRDTVVYANTPISWVLDSQGFGCDSIINASKLGINEPIFLDQGSTTLEIQPLEPGTYRFSCAMGMYQGTITAIDQPSLASNPGPR